MFLYSVVIYGSVSVVASLLAYVESYMTRVTDFNSLLNTGCIYGI